MYSGSFIEEISKGNTVVKFSAKWCMPCQMLKPVYEELKNEINDVKFLEIDIDDSNVPSMYSVRSVPTIILFKDGEEVERVVGNVSKFHIGKKIRETFEV